MASTIKVNNIQNQCGANIVNKCSTTITLGASGDNITLAAGATQSGFGRTGTVNWDTTAKTANFTAVSGNGYFVNTTSGAITVTLPATPSAGDIVAIADYARTFATNNVTVGRNGSNIQGAAADGTISTNGQSTTFVYVDGTQGWVPTEDQTTGNYGSLFVTATGGTITTCGDYKIHTFTGPGTFCVSCAGNPAGSTTVDYLVLAGGGSGGTQNGNSGGGGGAGGFRESSGTASGCYTASPLGACVSALPVSVTGYPITVGGGGAGIPGVTATLGNPGSNSVFSTITSTGGGYGSSNTGPTPRVGGPGGSGGGAGGGSDSNISGGTGNTPPVAPPQGNNGGSITSPHVPDPSSAGGGGAGGAGSGNSSPQCRGGPGGPGVTSAINGTSTGYSGGGGGGSHAGDLAGNEHSWPNGRAASPGIAQCATAGFGGGTGGRYNPDAPSTAGTTNKGGGGGGGNNPSGSGAGGSGIVIIRYKYQ